LARPLPSLIPISNLIIDLHPTRTSATTSIAPLQPANMSMSNEISPDQMQARIQQARREAENLKDRIKRKKDELADGTRK